MPARAAALLAGLLLVVPAAADEGLWTYDNPPLKQLKEKYGFEPTREWLDKVRLASVRFMDGGSGSFVSPDGLMITNHHVGLGCIQNLSSAENDYVKSLAWDYYFTDEQGRAVSVDARAILEALRKVYSADALVRELTGR
jgi:hypothetical protein